MRLNDDQPIHERVRILEEALASCLNRDETMCVEPFRSDGQTDQAVWVFERSSEDIRRGHDLHDIARDLERSLS